METVLDCKPAYTIPELAQYLNLKPITIEKLTRARVLPGFKAGGQWRFRRDTIERWISEQERMTKKGKRR